MTLLTGRRILVTGAAGFVGRNALDAFASLDAEAQLGIGRGTLPRPPASTVFRAIELDDREALREQVAAFAPTHILHLAAQSSVAQNATAAVETWQTNILGLFNLVEAIKSATRSATLLFVSSSEVYGRSFLSGKPLAEDVCLQPVGAYARTKRAGEEMLADLLEAGAVRLLIARPFNHTGPGQDERFVVPSFAGQIARLEAGYSPATLNVGNLDAQREFLDVRDVVRAYAAIIACSDQIEHGTVLNVANGAPRSIASVVEDLRRLARSPFEVCVRPDRRRPSEIAIAAGDGRKLQKLTGWTPMIPWTRTLADTLDYAREKLNALH